MSKQLNSHVMYFTLINFNGVGLIICMSYCKVLKVGLIYLQVFYHNMTTHLVAFFCDQRALVNSLLISQLSCPALE